MRENRSGAGIATEVIARRANARSDRTGEHPEKALDAVMEIEAVRKLEEQRERGRLKVEKREQARQASWESFMREERWEITLRENGQLERLLENTLAGESPEALRRLAHEDQRQAREGLVALMSDGKVTYKLLEELTIEDQPARTAAKSLRTAWLKERSRSWGGYGE